MFSCSPGANQKLLGDPPGSSKLTITSPSSGQLPNAVNDRAYRMAFSASGGSGAVTWSNPGGTLGVGVCAGLSLSGDGVLSGTPGTPSSVCEFTIQAKDSNNDSTTSTFSLNIGSDLVVDNATLGNGVQNRPFNQTLAISGGILPITSCNATPGLPAGMSITPSGSACVISGTPQATFGPASINISVADSSNGATGAGNASGNLTLQINAPLAVILPPRIINGLVGFGYSGVTFAATGGTGNGSNLTWTQAGATSASGLCAPAGAMPAGLSVSATSGNLSGMPTQASASPGDFQFQVCVEDAPTASTPAAAVVSGSIVLNVLHLYAYVTSSAQAIQVIDLASNTVVKSIPLSPYSDPIGLAVTPDGRSVFAVDNSTSQLIVVDTITNNQIAGSPFSLPATCQAPWGVAISPDPTQPGANRAFVTCSAAGDPAVEEVVVLDTTNPGAAPLAVIPTGFGSAPTDLVIRKDNSRVYASLNGTNQMFIIDNTLAIPAATPSSPFNFDPTTDQPLGIGLANNNGELYAYVGKQNPGNQVSANPFEGIEVVDVTTDAPTTVTTLPLAPGASAFPTDIAVDPAGALVFVTLQGAEQLAVLDNTIPIPAFVSGSPFNLPDPSGVAAATSYGVIVPPSPSGAPEVYVVLFSSSTISILTDTASPTVISGSPIALPTSSFPNEIRYIPLPK